MQAAVFKLSTKDGISQQSEWMPVKEADEQARRKNRRCPEGVAYGSFSSTADAQEAMDWILSGKK